MLEIVPSAGLKGVLARSRVVESVLRVIIISGGLSRFDFTLVSNSSCFTMGQGFQALFIPHKNDKSVDILQSISHEHSGFPKRRRNGVHVEVRL